MTGGKRIAIMRIYVVFDSLRCSVSIRLQLQVQRRVRPQRDLRSTLSELRLPCRPSQRPRLHPRLLLQLFLLLIIVRENADPTRQIEIRAAHWVNSFRKLRMSFLFKKKVLYICFTILT